MAASRNINPLWNVISKAVKQRDGNCCVRCGDNQTILHVHHIIPRIEWQDGGTDDPANLITLCASCHAQVTMNDEIFPYGEDWVRVRFYIEAINRGTLPRRRNPRDWTKLLPRPVSARQLCLFNAPCF